MEQQHPTRRLLTGEDLFGEDVFEGGVAGPFQIVRRRQLFAQHG